MKRHVFSTAAFSGAFIAAATFASPAVAQERYITIGTGGQTGVYYVVGQSVCRMVNRGSDEHNIRCNAPSTGGSVANVNGMKSGELDMGVVQSDVQYRAYNGEANFEEEGAWEDMRAVFTMHGEPLTVVARADPVSKTSATSLASASTSVTPVLASVTPWTWSWMRSVGMKTPSHWRLSSTRLSRQLPCLTTTSMPWCTW